QREQHRRANEFPGPHDESPGAHPARFQSSRSAPPALLLTIRVKSTPILAADQLFHPLARIGAELLVRESVKILCESALRLRGPKRTPAAWPIGILSHRTRN